MRFISWFLSVVAVVTLTVGLVGSANAQYPPGPRPTPTPSSSPSPSASPTPSPTPTPSATPTASPSPTPTGSPSEGPTSSPSPSDGPVDGAEPGISCSVSPPSTAISGVGPTAMSVLAQASAEAGDILTCVVVGMLPGSTATVTIRDCNGGIIFQGDVLIGDDGTATIDVAIPPGLPADCELTAEVLGLSADNQPVSLTSPLGILIAGEGADPDDMANTGSDAAAILLLGASAMAVGLVIVATSRRRRRSASA